MFKFGVVLVGLFVIMAAVAGFVAPFDFNVVRSDDVAFGILMPPSPVNIFGTTSLGMDVFSRLLLGSRSALLVILMSVAVSFIWGLLLSAISGKSGSKRESIVLFLADVFISVPSLLVAIVISLSISQGKSSFFAAIAATLAAEVLNFGSKYYRILRVALSEVRQTRFIEAAKVLGVSKSRLFFVHELPNSLSAVPVMMAQNASNAVFTLAGLGFLGIGIQANVGAEWGFDINKALSDLQIGIWWTSLFPGIALALLIVGFGLIAEGLAEEKNA